LRELGINHREWSFVEPSLIESRGVKANNHATIKQGYPTLRAHPFFGKMTSNELLSYACKPEHIANVDGYATVDTYFSNLITPEGAEYLSELYGYKGDYTDFISPKSYMEFTEMTLKLSDKYIRPTGGMSTIIATLKKKVEAMGGKIFTSTGIKSLFKEGTDFVLMTPKLRVNAKKLVVATPPAQFRTINGSTAKRIQDTAQFDSVQPIPAFKGAAVYANAWWENIRVAGSRVKPGQKFISHSNCLGISMAHRYISLTYKMLPLQFLR
jgi:phytoene dehydrogenase-like protein